MQYVLMILLAIHLISVAAIVGGWFAHFKTPTVTASQWWGSVGMILSGLAMAAIVSIPAAREAMGWGGSPNHLWLGIKLLVGAAVFVAALLGRRKSNRGEVVPTGLAHAVGGLGLVNILVAVFLR